MFTIFTILFFHSYENILKLCVSRHYIILEIIYSRILFLTFLFSKNIFFHLLYIKESIKRDLQLQNLQMLRPNLYTTTTLEATQKWSECRKTRTRTTLNTDAFHAVVVILWNSSAKAPSQNDHQPNELILTRFFLFFYSECLIGNKYLRK